MLMLCVVLTVVISQLHLLRNLTAMYAVVYFGSFALTMVVAALTLRSVDRGSRYLLKIVAVLFLIPCAAIVPGLVSHAPYTIASMGLGLGRLLFGLPIVVSVMLVPRTAANIRVLMVTAGALTVVAALSIPYQFINGSIAWFADSSERAGIMRFASLFGSITTLGIVCGMGIVVVAYSVRSATLISLALLSIAMGSILSLSKASLVNVAAALVALPFVRRTTWREALVFLVFFVVGLEIVDALFGNELLTFWSSFRLSDLGSNTLSNDVSLSEGLVDRLTALPMVAIRFHGAVALILGVGPIGGAGTFGFGDVPTGHNGVLELLLIGGLPMLFWYLWVNKRLVTASIAMMRTPGSRNAGLLSLFMFGSLFVNSIFSSSLIFSPIGALFFAIALKLVAPGVFTARGKPPRPDADAAMRNDAPPIAAPNGSGGTVEGAA